MLRIVMTMKETGDQVEICEGERLKTHAMRHLFVEIHSRRNEDPERDPINYYDVDGTVRELRPLEVEDVRMFKGDEDVTDEIVN